MYSFFMSLLGLALIIHLIFYIIRSVSEKVDMMRWEADEKKRMAVEEKHNEIKIIKKPGKTQYIKGSGSGILALHDNGKITVDMGFKYLIDGFDYRRYGNHYSIVNPTEEDKKILLDRLYEKVK